MSLFLHVTVMFPIFVFLNNDMINNIIYSITTDASGIVESDDIRLINIEIDSADSFSQKCTQLVEAMKRKHKHRFPVKTYSYKYTGQIHALTHTRAHCSVVVVGQVVLILWFVISLTTGVAWLIPS